MYPCPGKTGSDCFSAHLPTLSSFPQESDSLPPANLQVILPLDEPASAVPFTMLFDYVKIRFPTLDIQHIIKDILKLNINYMLHEDYGHYSYTEHYSLGDIFIYTSADEEKGVLLELKGRGCRQFESYLLAQQRSWYDFLMDALVDGGVMKRIDLAINDHTGILDIPELAEKCRKREYIGKSRSYKFYQSGELIKYREDDREYMGRTLYLGSLKSDVYFCRVQA